MGAIFAASDQLYHIVLVVAPGSALQVYVNGERLTDLQVPMRHIPANYALSIEWALWPVDSALVVAPRAGGRGFGSWSGDLFMLAGYSRPLSEADVERNYGAWLVDSAPLTPDVTVWGDEVRLRRWLQLSPCGARTSYAIPSAASACPAKPRACKLLPGSCSCVFMLPATPDHPHCHASGRDATAGPSAIRNGRI